MQRPSLLYPSASDWLTYIDQESHCLKLDLLSRYQFAIYVILHVCGSDLNDSVHSSRRMPPRQATLHMYLDSDAPHRSALLGIRALARLRAPLANHIRERARRYISARIHRGGSAGVPIVLDHINEDNHLMAATVLPLELECPICRFYFRTPVVSVIFINFVFVAHSSCKPELRSQLLSHSRIDPPL